VRPLREDTMNFDLNLGSSLETPSFFETAAQERIVPTLLSAFEHSLTVMAARHPGLLLRVHNRRDEAFFLLLLLVERQCLATCDASLSETLFGLIRTATGGSEMPRRKARWSLCFLVLLPYIQRKLERIAAPSLDAVADDVVPCPPVLCNQGVGQVLCAKSKIRFLPERMKPRANALQARDEDGAQPDQAGNEGFRLPEEARGWAHLPSAPSIPSAPSGGGTLALPGAAGDWRAWVRRVYPWVHAAKEGSVLTFHILFLFQRSRFSSPWLRALWLELRRASPKDAAVRPHPDTHQALVSPQHRPQSSMHCSRLVSSSCALVRSRERQGENACARSGWRPESRRRAPRGRRGRGDSPSL
jgi:hypothetical protein